MDTSIFNFDPATFTTARLQTEGWIYFTDPLEKAFAQLANHQGMTQWLPLLKDVTVTHPQTVPDGASTVGTTRTLTFDGDITLVEQMVFWNDPLCYAYNTQGKLFPLQNYIGLFGVVPEEKGGTIVFREYFDVKGRVKRSVIPYGIVPLMRQALKNLSKLIGGTEHNVRHVAKQTMFQLT